MTDIKANWEQLLSKFAKDPCLPEWESPLIPLPFDEVDSAFNRHGLRPDLLDAWGIEDIGVSKPDEYQKKYTLYVPTYETDNTNTIVRVLPKEAVGKVTISKINSNRTGLAIKATGHKDNLVRLVVTTFLSNWMSEREIDRSGYWHEQAGDREKAGVPSSAPGLIKPSLSIAQDVAFNTTGVTIRGEVLSQTVDELHRRSERLARIEEGQNPYQSSKVEDDTTGKHGVPVSDHQWIPGLSEGLNSALRDGYYEGAYPPKDSLVKEFLFSGSVQHFTVFMKRLIDSELAFWEASNGVWVEIQDTVPPVPDLPIARWHIRTQFTNNPDAWATLTAYEEGTNRSLICFYDGFNAITVPHDRPRLGPVLMELVAFIEGKARGNSDGGKTAVKVPTDRIMQASEQSRPESQESENRVLIVTVNSIETKAVLSAAQEYESISNQNNTYYDLGVEGGVHLFLVRSGMGTVGPSAATVTISDAIAYLRPDAIVATGVAFGVDPHKQNIGDILVSERVFFYEPQRVSTRSDNKSASVSKFWLQAFVTRIRNSRSQETKNTTTKLLRIPRGWRVPASVRLLDRFKDGEIHWTGDKLRFGLMLSGEELIDNLDRRDELMRLEPEAIGGEMEAAGLYSVADRGKIDWIVVKAICDWADGNKGVNKESNQELAARNAAEFLFFVIRRGGLADRRNILTDSLSPLQASLTNWIDISDQIVNPGFEEGFLGWEEDPSVIHSEQADSQSVADSSEVHNGIYSRKLFLREGGSYIKQTIELKAPLPVQCQIRLSAHIKMPFRGSSANKWFSLMLVTYGGGPDQVDHTQIEQTDSLAEWTKITVQTKQLDYPIHKLEIHAFTTRGGGVYKGFDKPVWLDDFIIEYRGLEL